MMMTRTLKGRPDSEPMQGGLLWSVSYDCQWYDSDLGSNIVTPSGSLQDTFLYLLVSESAPIMRAQDKGARILALPPSLGCFGAGARGPGSLGLAPVVATASFPLINLPKFYLSFTILVLLILVKYPDRVGLVNYPAAVFLPDSRPIGVHAQLHARNRSVLVRKLTNLSKRAVLVHAARLATNWQPTTNRDGAAKRRAAPSRTC